MEKLRARKQLLRCARRGIHRYLLLVLLRTYAVLQLLHRARRQLLRRARRRYRLIIKFIAWMRGVIRFVNLQMILPTPSLVLKKLRTAYQYEEHAGGESARRARVIV